MATRVGRRIGEIGNPCTLAQGCHQPEGYVSPMLGRVNTGLRSHKDRSKRHDFGYHVSPQSRSHCRERGPANRYNVNLNTTDVKIARTIARHIRESSGGLPHVQAKGITMEDTGLAQVTMNLLDYKATPIELVFSKIEEEAAKKGVEIVNSEIIGLIPLDALLDIAFARIKVKDFTRQRILDLAI